MTPEQEQKLNEVYEFIQSLKNSASIPLDVDAAFRERLFSSRRLQDIPSALSNAPRSAVTAPAGGGTVDAEARIAINAIITALEEVGLVTEN